jgi:hypothetical protein
LQAAQENISVSWSGAEGTEKKFALKIFCWLFLSEKSAWKNKQTDGERGMNFIMLFICSSSE